MKSTSPQRVLQRIRALFFLTVLLPIGLGAWLSYQQIESSLLNQSYLRSYDAARFHGTLIIEQLLRTDASLKGMIAKGIADSSNPLAADLIVIDPNNNVIEASGSLPIEQYPNINTSNTLGDQRSTIVTSQESAQIFLSGNADSLTEADARFIAQLNKQALFGNEEDQLVHAELCIIERTTVLHCTSALTQEIESLLDAMQAIGNDGRFAWKSASGYDYFGSMRELFLPSRFHSASWSIVVAEREDTVFAPIAVFRWLFPALSLLTIVVLLLLAVNQTRRQLGPLSKLRAHAARLGTGDFDTRLELETNNEFEALADSFNGMAERLGSQFQYLEAMSEIDAALLNSADLNRLSETILARVSTLLPVESAAILSLNTKQQREPSLLFYADHNQSDLQTEQEAIPAWLVQSLSTSEEVVSLDRDSEDTQALEGLIDGTGPLLIHPLHFEQRPLGALLLRHNKDSSLSDDDEERVEGIKDRLRVALSALDRQEKLYTQAHFDQLTSLPNRMLFVDRLNQSLAHAKRQNQKVAVIYADLDRFKIVNDTLGHDRGDQILKDAASRFCSLVRGSDTVARLSGDEFAIALPAISSHLDVVKVIKLLEAAFAKPFHLEGQEFQLNVSMGIALYPQDADTADNLLKNADIAMYRVKGDPINAFKFYEQRMNQELLDRTTLAQQLQHAVRNNGLSIAYQPKVDCNTHRIVSAEALIRWEHPVHGWISPAKFIPIAEEAGLIPEIGEYVLNAACEQMDIWRNSGLNINQIAVNVSPRQIQYTDFVSIVERTLSTMGLPPSCLELEITEDLLIEDYEKTEMALSRLKALGVGLALDDFGTGYSSLGHLHELSFDTLKIDKCFVDNIGTSDNSDAIVMSVVALGKTLDKKLVAEGVETVEQLRFLTKTGCHLIQGYYFSKPLMEAEFTQLLNRDCPLPYSEPKAVAVSQ